MHYHIAIAVIIWAAVFVEARKIRGISLSYKRFYKERKSFVCIDGSKLIPFEQVNDDYCDCADGSDEPGTAACPNGRFYCTNLGFRPGYIPSSRVNDGICDCCDGSEEYNSPTLCQNTCRNLGQRERAELEERMRMLSEGADVWREKQAELANLWGVASSMLVLLEQSRERKAEADRALMAAQGFRGQSRTQTRLEGLGQSPQDTERLGHKGEGDQARMDSAPHRGDSPNEAEGDQG
ncbi:hypothetical protein ACEWY4_024747 [Coilia grayii]|uniref:Glucosidase II beta subunit N-terminal domain-containing protein n=1 Tax=Coilia grayii TaxID=363190 RepID=A0ABD1IVK5_9TELE